VSIFCAPIRRRETARGHRYVDAEGRRVPGVTTVLGDGLPKTALINWAANATAEAAVNRWEELSVMPPAQRLKVLQGARWQEKDQAANRGGQIHALAEHLVRGESVQVPEEIAGRIEAYARFLEDFDVAPVHVEFSLASYRHGYAGTGDLIARLTVEGVRRLALLDLKTNRSGIFGETALQLAAYRYADVLITAEGEEPMPGVDLCAAVHIRSDGYSLVPLTAGPEEHLAFLYVQQVAQWAKTSRELVGNPVDPPTASTFRLVRETGSAS
jgi:hypothetical protein